MNDLINRQEAINAICAICGLDCDKSKFRYNCPQDEQVILCPEHYVLYSLPSSNQWISVSERLPEETVKVLVQADDMYYNMNNDTGILIGWRNGNKWSTLKTKGWEYIRYPIAWMPLPEPYKK